MADKLSLTAEDYIARALASGAFASRTALLEASVAALREKVGDDSAAASDTPSFSTVELSPEECAKLQAEALGKTAPSGKSSGYSIQE